MTNNINEININFGDLTLSQRIQHISNKVEGLFENILESIGSPEVDSVFSGEVASETVKWQGRIHNLGVIMREGQEKASFNSKM